MIQSIDGDVSFCGVAFVRDSGALAGALLTPPDAPMWPALPDTAVRRIVVEGVNRVRVPLRDLIACQHAGSSLAGRYAAGKSIPIELVYAEQWAGSIQKDIRQARTIAELRPDERRWLEGVPRSRLSELIDAIGIGFFVTGRTGRGGVPR